jgi:hypothetical protein
VSDTDGLEAGTVVRIRELVAGGWTVDEIVDDIERGRVGTVVVTGMGLRPAPPLGLHGRRLVAETAGRLLAERPRARPKAGPARVWSTEEVDATIAAMTVDGNPPSDKEVARALGCSPRTVARRKTGK